MSVLECHRKDCTHIMCNRYNSKFGHICDDCYEELTNFIKSRGGVISEQIITEFMNSTVRHKEVIDKSVEESLDLIFPSRSSQ